MEDVNKALQQAHSAVWSLHQSSRGRVDSEGHRKDAVRSLKAALKLLKRPKKED